MTRLRAWFAGLSDPAKAVTVIVLTLVTWLILIGALMLAGLLMFGIKLF